jgi:hypothetical protein
MCGLNCKREKEFQIIKNKKQLFTLRTWENRMERICEVDKRLWATIEGINKFIYFAFHINIFNEIIHLNLVDIFMIDLRRDKSNERKVK